MDRTHDDDARTLEVFGRWYTAHESGDVAGLNATLGDEATVHSLFKPTPARGREAAVAHFTGVNATFSPLAMSLRHTPAAADGRVFAEVEFSGAFTGELTWGGVTTRGAGQGFRVPGVVVVRVADSAVRSVRTLFDRDEWLRQIGIPARWDDLEGARR
ncbi:nuclear transport factor 2 family protein [Amycolatopsis rhizosphaerae]|uniref:nuclear transport factor 2 family protein n=1 Tax=Amycolatopsis rhizosphaerae TaxID=2053003 RepID=UPI001643E990|nr:nuclear transport factor 2 family protein [Amycolatopsis rhizosphaerae]